MQNERIVYENYEKHYELTEMENVITFTRIFSDYHIRKGEPTYFVEQILNNLINQNINCDVAAIEKQLGLKLFPDFRIYCGSKGHTIRSGNDWKVGDQFVAGIWLDIPRMSKIIKLEPAIEIKKIWTFECNENGEIKVDGYPIREEQKVKMAKNDGLSLSDFEEWLVVPFINAKKYFRGQIICWDDAIKYDLG